MSGHRPPLAVCDPGWKTCKGCDFDFDRSVRFVNGLCPECAREKELADAAEEELADAMENEKQGAWQ